jgi:hypothetical protein
LRKAIAEAKRPDVGSIERISNINFDGLLVRYTDDPAPRAVLGESQNSGFTIDLSLNFLQMKSALNALRLYTGLYHGNAGRIAEMVEIGQLQPRCVISGARVEMAADKAEMFHAALSSISDKIGVNQSAAAGPGSLLSALTAALREHDVAWLSVSDDDLQEDDALLAAEPLVAKFEAPDFS